MAYYDIMQNVKRRNPLADAIAPKNGNMIYRPSTDNKIVNMPYRPSTGTPKINLLSNAIGGGGGNTQNNVSPFTQAEWDKNNASTSTTPVTPTPGPYDDYIKNINSAGSGAQAEYWKGELKKKAEADGITYEQALSGASTKLNDNIATVNTAPKLADVIAPTDTTTETKTDTKTATGTGGNLSDAIAPPKATDSTGLIYDINNSISTALKAAIQQDINNKNQQIAGLDQKYQGDIDQSEVRKENELRTSQEQSANAGDRGGIGRQLAAETQWAGENRLNAINLQKKNEEASLKNDIANLILEGDIQAANQKANMLKDLIANNQYVDETNYNRGQDTTKNNQWQQQFDWQKEQTGKDNEFRQEQFDWQKEQANIDNAFRQGQFDWQKEQTNLDRAWQQGQFDYQKARDAVSDERYKTEWQQKLDEWAFQKQSTEWEQRFSWKQFDYQKAQDALQQSNYSKELKLKLDQFAFDKQQATINNEFREKQAALDYQLQNRQISQQAYESARSANLRQQEINLSKLESDRAYTLQQTNATIDDYTNYISSAYVTTTYDAIGNKSGTSVNSNGVKKYLESLQAAKVSPDVLKKIAQKFGIIYE